MSWGELLEELNALPIEEHMWVNGVAQVELDHRKQVNLWSGNTPAQERIEELEGFLNDLSILVKEKADE